MEKQVFIAREKQLEQLKQRLVQAAAGHGQVCFITGEAGSGKTTLVNEFTRRVQAQNEELVVAVGQCDAQSGVGDAHLPFRQVMAQLTGDVETKLAQGAITEENASRLRKMLVFSGQALVDVGPDLIGIFVPGIGLATRVGAFVAEKAGWLDKLEKLAVKPKGKPGDTGLQESHVFEQYANVLGRLAQKNPLLVVLDDLHWADAASIGLLFHLGRTIAEHKIFILGTYRSAEVAIGRGGERHPLEKVLAEFKRYYGEIWIDLDQAVEQEGEFFVEAFLDSEPNALGADFSARLYHHTGGHPLFTVELLRNMQERGDLVQDRLGRWVTGASLDWNTLPSRVEGVIEERIGRLQDELRQMLTVGSVQGEDFTAEVVARVQKAEAGGLIRRLSSELERQHRLVHAEGVRRLDPGGQRISLFRFQHNLFRTYLYNELSEAERVYLHEDVGHALEALYCEQADEIAVQLALHFEIAGAANKARHYLQIAGGQATNRFANDEALDYFNRALALTSQSEIEQRYELLMAREQIFNLKGERSLQAEDLAALQGLSSSLTDEQKKAEVTLRRADYAFATSDYPAAITAAQELLSMAAAKHNPGHQALGHFVWGDVARRQGDYDTSRQQWEQALAMAQAAGLRQVEANSLRGLGALDMDTGDFDQAIVHFDESARISEEIGDRSGRSKTFNNLGMVYSIRGDFSTASIYYEQAATVFREMGDRPREAVLLGNLGVSAARQGDLKAALGYFRQSQQTSHKVGDRDSECRMLNNLGNLSAQMGDLAEARRYLEQALQIANEIGHKNQIANTLDSLGLIFTQLGQYTAAEAHSTQALQIASEIGAPQVEVAARVKLGLIREYLGDTRRAQRHFESSLEAYRALSEKQGEASVLAYLGLLNHHLGQDETAQATCQQAIAITQVCNSPEEEANAVTYLGHALSELGKLDEAGEAYRRGLRLRQELGQPHMTTEPLAGLARLWMRQENPVQALVPVEEILGVMQHRSLDGTDETMRVYLTCYQVLKANQDPRSSKILKEAHALLMERAEMIEDEAARRSYLENVAANREVRRAGGL